MLMGRPSALAVPQVADLFRRADVAEMRPAAVLAHQRQNLAHGLAFGMNGDDPRPVGVMLRAHRLILDQQRAGGLVVIDFQAADAIRHRVIVPPVLGHGRAVVNRPIAVRLRAELAQFAFQRGRLDGRRRGVGHIEDGPVAPGQCGSGLAGEGRLVRPVHPAQMDVRIKHGGNLEDHRQDTLTL